MYQYCMLHAFSGAPQRLAYTAANVTVTHLFGGRQTNRVQINIDLVSALHLGRTPARLRLR